MRQATICRQTGETKIEVSIDLDEAKPAQLDSGIAFLDHMLDQIAWHGTLDLQVQASGDLKIDDHHTVEDVGIVFGQAIAKALGNCAGIQRYGYAYVPLDEALSRVVIDFSGRSELVFNVPWKRARVGNFDVDLASEFFKGFCRHAKATLHVDNLRGDNAHHQIESVFKAFGRALRMAVAIDTKSIDQIPSTKGSL